MAEKLNTDAVYRGAKAKEKDYTINDGSGLALLVKSNGSKLWRFIYRFNSKQNRLGFGAYPDVTLEQARKKAQQARSQIADGIDPSAVKKDAKAAQKQAAEDQARIDAGLPIVNSFEYVCRAWLESTAHKNRDHTHHKKLRRFELYVC